MTARRLVLIITLLSFWSPLTRAESEDLAGSGLEDRAAASHPTSPGEALPTFRGTLAIRGSIAELLAVLRDVPSISQWAYGISDAQLLKHVSPNVDLIYLFSHTPWPLHDRDMTVRREIQELSPGQSYRIVLLCQAGIRPVRDDIVRVRECHSEFRLQRMDEHNTMVEYSASLDPAGRVPNWTKSFLARTVPARTLAALQKRVFAKRK